jgi:hypothetical protein
VGSECEGACFHRGDIFGPGLPRGSHAAEAREGHGAEAEAAVMEKVATRLLQQRLLP